MTTEERKLLRISELAEATGVSAQTIHYYLREGLLPPPIKTAPNMAYYGPEHLEDIRLIKELQEKRYLPLSVIKLVLEAKREGKDVSQLQDMRLGLEEIFRPVWPEEGLEPVSLVQLVAVTGLSAATIEALEGIGLLMPANIPQGKRYDGLDVRIAQEVKKLLDLGLTTSDLSYYSQFIEALRTEARVIYDKVVHSRVRTGRVSGVEVKAILDSLKSSLMVKVYRHAVFGLRGEEADEHRSD